jgi:HlyD family secretion protein
MSKKVIIITVILLAVGLVFWLSLSGRKNKEPKFRTEKIQRGDVITTVTATGTLSALTTVQVGSQVSGRVN